MVMTNGCGWNPSASSTNSRWTTARIDQDRHAAYGRERRCASLLRFTLADGDYFQTMGIRLLRGAVARAKRHPHKRREDIRALAAAEVQN